MIAPLFFYIWIPGASRAPGAIVQNGRTLYGPIDVGPDRIYLRPVDVGPYIVRRPS